MAIFQRLKEILGTNESTIIIIATLPLLILMSVVVEKFKLDQLTAVSHSGRYDINIMYALAIVTACIPLTLGRAVRLMKERREADTQAKKVPAPKVIGYFGLSIICTALSVLSALVITGKIEHYQLFDTSYVLALFVGMTYLLILQPAADLTKFIRGK